MKKSTKKILHFKDLTKHFSRNNNNRIVLCYGHFNTLHPGHFRYFEYARKFGEELYILLQSDEEIDKDIRSHYFSQTQRAEALSEIEKVDGIILYGKNLLKAISIIKAGHLVLGKEHEFSKVPLIKKAVNGFKKNGGKIIFHAGDIVYADSKLSSAKENNVHNERIYNLSSVLERHNIKKRNL